MGSTPDSQSGLWASGGITDPLGVPPHPLLRLGFMIASGCEVCFVVVVRYCLFSCLFYFRLYWVFIAVPGLSLVTLSWDSSPAAAAQASLQWLPFAKARALGAASRGVVSAPGPGRWAPRCRARAQARRLPMQKLGPQSAGSSVQGTGHAGFQSCGAQARAHRLLGAGPRGPGRAGSRCKARAPGAGSSVQNCTGSDAGFGELSAWAQARPQLGPRAQAQQLWCLSLAALSLWDLPRPGTRPTPLAPGRWVLTTGPSGSPASSFFKQEAAFERICD